MSIFRTCVKVALNALVKSWALRAWTWASWVTKALHYPFSPLGICQTNVLYVTWGKITVLNICLGAKKFPLHIDPAILEKRSYDFHGFSFGFWYMVFLAKFWLQGYTKIYDRSYSINYMSFLKFYASCIVYISISAYINKRVF